MSRLLKRLALGRPISTYEELDHRLPKRIALAIFSSDALSSSAYATDEILLALALAGAVALGLAAPIGMVVAVVLIVVIISYRQTVKAYPGGGGAYVVAHENLGKFPGLIAASSLLIDYVLTAAVSLAAGVAAVGAAFPPARDFRIQLAVAALLLITVMNLRGVKEAGTLFAIPTYAFLATMAVMIVLGAAKVLSGNIEPYPPADLHAEQSLTLFLILRAFASGSTALTGVEAISNGVPAFQKPEDKNAAQTLSMLGALLAFLFLGITLLAHELRVDPAGIEHGRTVTSQIAARVFGPASLLFYAVQIATSLILFLAANTSFAGFPRLGSILAKDRYLPRVLENRGDRLAYSNGIIILTVAASALLVHYKADVHKIIPLYVIGVFTSFTLSQAGMVAHWFKAASKAALLRQPPPRGWKRSAVVNGIGAFTTLLVLVIVSLVKFTLGAWQIMIMIPALAILLRQINVHYMRVRDELRLDRKVPQVHKGKVLLVVSGLHGVTKALAFARAIAPMELKAVALGTSSAELTELRTRWDQMGIKLSIEPLGRDVDKLLKVVEEMGPRIEEPITVILPDPQYRGWLQQIVRNRLSLKVKRAFLYTPNTVLVSVPFHPRAEPEPERLRAPGRLSLIVFVSGVHRATVQALEYARSLNPSELKAMTIQTHDSEVARLDDEWTDWGIDIPLEIVDSPYRGLMQPLLREVRELRPNPDDAVGVVVPEFVVPWWQAFLHNQTAFLIKTALLFEPNVVVINVPYRLGANRQAPEPAGR